LVLHTKSLLILTPKTRQSIVIKRIAAIENPPKSLKQMGGSMIGIDPNISLPSILA
jgi:hypothetical protein